MELIDFSHHTEYVWLLAGVLIIAFDALHLGGVGLMFAGLGAFSVGIITVYNQADSYQNQFILFFISTAIWAALLWKPLQKFRIPKAGHEYRNIVGETALVGSAGIDRTKGGEVTWSGTIMRAELVPGVDRIEAGSKVEIVKVRGATLLVKLKEI